MSVSATMQQYMRSKGCEFEVMWHPHTRTSMETAEAAHIPGDRLAKAVLLSDAHGYVAVVLPSTYHVGMAELRARTGRDLSLVPEWELRELFKDCEAGAIPAACPAYGMETYLDESLAAQPDVYLEGGDHEALIHMRIDQFLDLMEDATRTRVGYRM
ncbi:deacylase [Imbroritus primus]|jgi:Ala-tRNA(Pro) deacylase|uniref:Deacylase n=1 Tax=Imbroritus primus TaxID=3058603 RepID=A0ACD3STJ7_9BURK|nr:deacylase [Burkholderiaceae bacterium PBA]HVL09338.1 YbaK/EbsC family protein [Burkholderiaceae bacterium]